MSVQIGTAAGYTDLLTRLDAFLTATGHAWGATFNGIGNGRLRGPGGTVGGYLGTAASTTETITATATSATAFTVSGSISGDLGVATVDADFVSSVVTFRIASGTTPFQAGDRFRINTSRAWTRLRFGGCPDSRFRTATFSDIGTLFDDSYTTGIQTTVVPASITLQMIAPTPVRSMAIWCFSTPTAPSDFRIDYSDDGMTWTPAQSWTGQTWPQSYARRDFVVADVGPHLYWRLVISAAASATLRMTELRLFGDASSKWDVSRRVEFAWQAPGVDGNQTIYIAGYTQADSSADSYNLVWRGFRHWIDRDLSIVDVPDNGGDKAQLLTSVPLAYWFMVNGGRVIVATRISTTYQWSYAGYGLPYETPTDHAYPYLSGASWTSGSARWDLSNTAGYRNPADPGSGSGNNDANATLAAYYPNGAWRQVCNRYSQSNTSEGAADTSTRGKTWPYSVSSSTQIDHFRNAIDDSAVLTPVVITSDSPRHAWGEMDGVYYLSGWATSGEAVVRKDAIDLVVIPNITRGTLNNYAAIALD